MYGAKRGALRRNFESHDRWQSQANGLSDKRKARRRGMLENISRGIVVMLLLLSVKISSSWRFLIAISSMQTIWLWSNWRLRSAGTPLNIRFDIAAISLFDKSLKTERRRQEMMKWKKGMRCHKKSFTYTLTKLDMLESKLSGSVLILLLFNRLRKEKNKVLITANPKIRKSLKQSSSLFLVLAVNWIWNLLHFLPRNKKERS